MPKFRPIEERFFEKIELIPFHSCWEWIASKHRIGYGTFGFRKKVHYAHRVSWILHFGEIPEGQCILHRCDNRSCVNPDHLFIGTQLENINDMIKKGRRRLDPRGSKHPLSKLTESDIIEIRRLYSLKEMMGIQIADKFGISKSAVSMIARRRTWTHI